MTIPVTLDDAKAQLRIELADTDQDAEIAGFITDAAAWVEQYTGHLLTARDVTERFRWPARCLDLAAWPIAAEAAPGVAYVDATGTPVAIVGARLDVSRRPARVLPPTGTSWPIGCDQSLTVTIRAGYEDGDVVPGNIRRAILVLIGGYNQDREGGELFQKAADTARGLCAAYRLWLL